MSQMRRLEGPGYTIITCSRGAKCRHCSSGDVSYSCTFELGGSKAGQRCGASLCAKCARPQGKGFETSSAASSELAAGAAEMFCPPHHDLAARKRAEQQHQQAAKAG